MLYLLLTIIAVGVLLASEAGKNLLGGLIVLIIIGGLLYLGFWVVVITIALLQNQSVQYMVKTIGILGIILLMFIMKQRNKEKKASNTEKTDAKG